jgi:hypothetical protein
MLRKAALGRLVFLPEVPERAYPIARHLMPNPDNATARENISMKRSNLFLNSPYMFAEWGKAQIRKGRMRVGR